MKTSDEEIETPEEEIETPEEETEMPKQAKTCFFRKEEACKALHMIPQSVKEHNTAVTSSSQVGGTEFLF